MANDREFVFSDTITHHDLALMIQDLTAKLDRSLSQHGKSREIYQNEFTAVEVIPDFKP